MTTTIYLVTGANRGLGLGVVQSILIKDPTAFVYAGARDIAGPAAEQLLKLRGSHSRRLELLQYVSADEEGNARLAESIRAAHGRVDVVIANAAISNFFARVEDTPPDVLRAHFKINTTGFVVLFQALYTLLKASADPKLIAISTHGGSLTFAPPFSAGYTSYGVSKAALNWIARKIHFENQWLTCFPLAPGGIDTDMARAAIDMDKTGAIAEMMEGNTVSVDIAADRLVDLVRTATRDTHGGKFVVHDGSTLPW